MDSSCKGKVSKKLFSVCGKSNSNWSMKVKSRKVCKLGRGEKAGSPASSAHTDGKQLGCETLGKLCSNSYTWEVHERIPMDENPACGGRKSYRCEMCGILFFSNTGLILHERSHSSEKLLEQEKEETNRGEMQSFVEKHGQTLTHLKPHKRIHTGEKPFRCDTCGKSFSQNCSLINHKRTHTGEKPYGCETCGRSFSVKSNLVCHKRTHTGERPFNCEVCGRSFSQLDNLTSHKRTHTGERPFECKYCGKSFSLKSSLVCHKRIHTGEKPYTCETCGKSFSVSSSLKNHKRIHTGEKPYRCEICGKLFSVKSNLNCHKRKHNSSIFYK